MGALTDVVCFCQQKKDKRQDLMALVILSDKTAKFVDGDVLEARGDEIPESTFTEEAKAEDA